MGALVLVMIMVKFMVKIMVMVVRRKPIIIVYRYTEDFRLVVQNHDACTHFGQPT